MGEKEKWTCKHCGDDEGVSFRERQVYERILFGDGESEAEYIGLSGEWPKTGKCVSCGKRTNLPPC
jgi:hypothetical protein